MRNLARLTNAANRLQAHHDWEEIKALAIQRGIDPTPYEPAPDAGWRKIDKAIVQLRAVISKERQ